MSKTTGGSAFPRPATLYQTSHREVHAPQPGMSLRDYFAAKAMQTLIACAWERSGDTNYIIDNDGRVSLHLRAYEHADAMLEMRNKGVAA